MAKRFDDEILVAYVDGELDESGSREVEAALAHDTELRATVEGLRESAAVVRAAFNEPLRAPVPQRLVEAVDAGFAEPARGHGGGAGSGPSALLRRPVFGSIAASILAVIVGLSGAYYFAELQVERRIARLEAIRTADQAFIETTISRALEKHVSGTQLDWSNPDSGSKGRIEPIRTFKISTGEWCREYVHTLEFHGWQELRETRRAVACREGDGRWRTRLSLTGES